MMYKIEFIDIDNPNITYEVECGTLSIILDKTSYSDRTDYNVTQYKDYTAYEESDLIVEDEISFQVMEIGNINYDEFKSFIRGRDKSFILRITKDDNNPRMAICKHYSEDLNILGYSDFNSWDFSVLRCTRWIEIASVGFDLNTQIKATGTYSNSETFTDGYQFADSESFDDGMIYGGSAQTIESFIVDLPINDGDKFAYLRTKITDANSGFAFGLDNPWEDTIEAFKAKETLSIIEGQSLIIDSYPPFKQVNLKTSSGLINKQGEREVSKRTYLRIPLGEHHIEFEGVRSGSIIMYKQYRLPF